MLTDAIEKIKFVFFILKLNAVEILGEDCVVCSEMSLTRKKFDKFGSPRLVRELRGARLREFISF